MRLAGGVRLGPYEILAVLGAGGMGDVYTARDTRLDRIVAIKVLRPRPGVDISDQALGEARAAARFNHPHIATLYDVVEGMSVDGVPLSPFLVMEYVDGRPLSAIIAEGPADVDRALAIAIQLADALAAAHREGVIHRDVKPANVMLARDGAVKLLDLGIARALMTGGGVTTTTSPAAPARAPQPVDGGGTPAYMSPEQLSGQPTDARSDIYGAGILLFELLTGRRPFVAPDLATLAMVVTTRPAPRVSSVRAAVPAALDDVVARAIATDPAERFASADELRDALIAARDGDTAGSAPRAWLRRAGPVAAIVVIAAAATLWTLRGTPHKRAPIAVLPAVSAGDEVVVAFGSGLSSMLADNLASVRGLTVIPPAGAGDAYRGRRRDLAAAARELGAGYVVDLQLSGSGTQVHVDGALIETGLEAPLWQRGYDGSPFDVERWVTDQVAAAIEHAGILGRSLSSGERARLRRLPTSDAAAFAAYAQAQVRLEGAKGAADVQDAIASLREAIEKDTRFALARATLSDAFGRMYSYTLDPAWIARASDEANKAIALDPDRAQVHYSLGAVYEATGRFEDAQQHAEEAVRLSPDSDDAHRLLGNVLADRGETDKAVTELQLAIQLRPDYARNHATLGYVLYKAARYRQAVEPLREAVRLRPSAPNFRMLGTALHASGNIDEAIGNYIHAIQLSKDPVAFANLAFSYYMAGRYQEALANWQASLGLEKAPTGTRFRNIGDAYERLGQPEKARGAYQEAIARAQQILKVNPAEVEQIAIVAICEAKLGRHDEAALRAAEALALRPQDSDVLYKAAVVDALAGRNEPALRRLGDALSRGYPAAFARADFDLSTLRSDPRFTALIAQHAQ